MKKLICLLSLLATPAFAQGTYPSPYPTLSLTPYPTGNPMLNPSVSPTTIPLFNCSNLLGQMADLDEQHVQLILQTYPLNESINEKEKKLEGYINRMYKLFEIDERLRMKKLSSGGLTPEEQQEYDLNNALMGILALDTSLLKNEIQYLKEQKDNIINQINSIMMQRSFLQSLFDLNCR